MKRLGDATAPELDFIRRTLKLRGRATAEQIAAEYRRAGGHSLANAARRGQGASYHQILVDVADKLILGLSWTKKTVRNTTGAEMECAVLRYAEQRRRKFIDKLTADERRKLLADLDKRLSEAGLPALAGPAIGSGAGAIAAAFAATPVATALFYQGFLAGIYAGILGPTALALLGGGALVAGAVAVPVGVGLYVASPAYKKTIPVTMAIAAIGERVKRQARLERMEDE